MRLCRRLPRLTGWALPVLWVRFSPFRGPESLLSFLLKTSVGSADNRVRPGNENRGQAQLGTEHRPGDSSSPGPVRGSPPPPPPQPVRWEEPAGGWHLRPPIPGGCSCARPGDPGRPETPDPARGRTGRRDLTPQLAADTRVGPRGTWETRPPARTGPSWSRLGRRERTISRPSSGFSPGSPRPQTETPHLGLRGAGAHQHRGLRGRRKRSRPPTGPLIGRSSELRRLDWEVFRALPRQGASDWTVLPSPAPYILNDRLSGHSGLTPAQNIGSKQSSP